MASPPHFPAHVKGIRSLHKNTGKCIRRRRENILTTGSEVKRQVLLPATEIQAWRRKEAGRFKKGGRGPARDLGKQMVILSLWREVELEQRYEENGKACGRRRKDVSWSQGRDEVVGLSTGWAGRAQHSLEPYEPSRVGQRESQLHEIGNLN